jgi:hypothetical protein
MEEVARRWPDSLWASRALMASAEGLFRKSSLDANLADERTTLALRILAPLATECPERPIQVAANVGMAVIYASGGRLGSAEYSAQRARDLAADANGPPAGDMEVAFADFRGRLDDVLKKISKGAAPGPLRQARYVSNIQMPLSAAMSFKDDGWVILRDHLNRPVRVDQRILMLLGNRAVLVNTASGDANLAVDWQALTAIDPETNKRYFAQPGYMRLVAGVSADEKIIAICDRASLRGFDVRTARAAYIKTMAEIGLPGGAQAMAIADGLAVFSDNGARLACVDLATGEVLWNDVRMRGRQMGPISGPPEIHGRYILVRYYQGQKMTCLDARDHGRVLNEWQGSSTVNGIFAPNGTLAVLDGRTLSVFDAAQLGGKPLWTRAKYEPSRQPVLLAVSNDYVAVAPSSTASSSVEILPVSGGDQSAATIQLPEIGGQRSLPLNATIDGASLLVTTSGTQVGGRVYAGQPYVLQTLGLHRVDLEKKKRSWSYDGGASNAFASEPVVGLEHVAMLYKNTSGYDMGVHVLDLQTGKRVGKVDFAGRYSIQDQRVQQRLYMLGPPAMTNGRLAVETMEGVAVYGGQ